MRGIVGIFAADEPQVVSADLRGMAAASLLPRCDPEVDGSDVSIWFDGRLDNRQDLETFVRPSPVHPSEMSDAALVLAVYREHGEDVGRALNGDFAFAIIDRAARRAVLARDVMASHSLYYCLRPDALLFASEIKCLLAHPGVTVAIDEDALAELVIDSWCDANRTCFKGIYSVPPGYAVIATSDRILQRRQWTFDPTRQTRYRSFDDYRDHFKVLFDQAVRRRIRGVERVAVGVSGGLDSSSIFCNAVDLTKNESLRTVVHGLSMTFPPGTPADERGFLDDIERRWQLPITRVPVSEYHYFESSDGIVRRLDTPGSLQQEHAGMFDTARCAGCRVFLSGFFGDQVLSENAYFLDLARRGRWLKLRRDLRTFRAWFADDPDFVLHDFGRRVVRALPPRWLFRIAKRIVRRARARTRYPPWFTAEFCRRAEARALTRFDERRRYSTAHAERYYLHATAGHYINIVRCDRAAGQAYGVDVRFPFRDRDLVAFLMAIPGEIVNWQGVPKGLLRHALAGILPDTIRNRRTKADFTALENRAMRRDASQIASLMRPDALGVRARFVDGSALDRAVATFAALNDEDGTLPGWAVSDLAGLEMWLRRFFAPAAIAA